MSCDDCLCCSEEGGFALLALLRHSFLIIRGALQDGSGEGVAAAESLADALHNFPQSRNAELWRYDWTADFLERHARDYPDYCGGLEHFIKSLRVQGSLLAEKEA